MFFGNEYDAAEIGLLLRAIMYAMLFLGMGVVVWQAQESAFGPRINKALVKALSILCFLVAAVNVFMAFEWLVIYFV